MALLTVTSDPGPLFWASGALRSSPPAYSLPSLRPPPLLEADPAVREGTEVPTCPSSCRPLGAVCCQFTAESPVQRALLRSVRSQGAAPAWPSGPTIRRNQSSGLTGPLPRLGPCRPSRPPSPARGAKVDTCRQLHPGSLYPPAWGPEMGQDDFSPAQPLTVHPRSWRPPWSIPGALC